MALLAIDASTEACSAALLKGDQRFVRQSDTPRAHAQALLPMIDELLSEAGITLNELEAIGLVNGPGSFTGIRIALSVVQGLAYGASLPIVTASSLHILAQAALEHSFISSHISSDDISPMTLICALDARMSEVYWAAYRVDIQSAEAAIRFKLSEIRPAQASAYLPFSYECEILCESEALCVGIGNAWSIPALDTVNVESHSGIEPHANAMLDYMMSLEDLDAHKLEVYEVEPLYVRNEVAWKKRKKIRESSI